MSETLNDEEWQKIVQYPPKVFARWLTSKKRDPLHCAALVNKYNKEHNPPPQIIEN